MAMAGRFPARGLAEVGDSHALPEGLFPDQNHSFIMSRCCDK
jgi:hypothetical protein